MILLFLLGETLRAAVDGQPELCDRFYAYSTKLALEVVEDRRIRDLAVGSHRDGFLPASGLPIAEALVLPVDFGLALAALNVARVDPLHHCVCVLGDGEDFVRLRVAFGSRSAGCCGPLSARRPAPRALSAGCGGTRRRRFHSGGHRGRRRSSSVLTSFMVSFSRLRSSTSPRSGSAIPVQFSSTSPGPRPIASLFRGGFRPARRFTGKVGKIIAKIPNARAQRRHRKTDTILV